MNERRGRASERGTAAAAASEQCGPTSYISLWRSVGSASLRECVSGYADAASQNSSPTNKTFVY